MMSASEHVNNHAGVLRSERCDRVNHDGGRSLVEAYLNAGFRIVTWSATGTSSDAKGPHGPGAKDWQHRTYTINDYKDGYRVGLLTGYEISQGKYLHDVDIDWTEGANLALPFLPRTGFVYGRASKKISHCFYTLPEALPSYKYEDIDGSCLIELRGTKREGDVGMQSMGPPSIWSKGEKREPLLFVLPEGTTAPFLPPAHIEVANYLSQRVTLAAITMMLGKHLGINGFGHEPRLAWSGFLLRLGISIDDLMIMGTALSHFCNNREMDDVRRSLESTQTALLGDTRKVKGGPALAKLLGTNGRKIVSRIAEWLGRDDFIRNRDGVIVKDHQENIERALHLLGVELSYNTFTAAPMILVPPATVPVKINDDALSRLRFQIEREFGFRPTRSLFEEFLRVLARDNSFHPVLAYLDGLKWDGVPRIAHWLVTYAGAVDGDLDPDQGERQPPTYREAISAIVLIAAVRRVKQPGCKYDEMLVLESGQQGTGKSTALCALCPNEEWFSDGVSLNDTTQKLIEHTLGKWIIEVSDLAGRDKADVEQLKAMLSRRVDGPVRMAYAHEPEERPRHFILIGTTNSAAYLADITGARRFWPVRISRFDVDALTNDRDQLWAEAVVRERAGESIRLPESLWKAAAVHQEERRQIDPWEEAITQYVCGLPMLKAYPPDSKGERHIPTRELWTAVGLTTAERRDGVGSSRISKIMQRLGFRRSTMRAELGDTGVKGEPEGCYVGVLVPPIALAPEVDVHRQTALAPDGGDDATPF